MMRVNPHLLGNVINFPHMTIKLQAYAISSASVQAVRVSIVLQPGYIGEYGLSDFEKAVVAGA